MTKVACIGECMVELKQADGGLFSRGYGGDTLNTAVYLARLGVGVDYITALGDDALSDEMIAGWAAEGVGTKRVRAAAGQAAGPLHDPDRRQGRAAVLPLARQRRRAQPDGFAADAGDPEFARRLRRDLSLGDHAVAVWRGGTGAAVRGAWTRARELAHASRSTPISAPAAGPISTSRVPSSRRPSRRPISCWPRRRICCRSIPAKAPKICWRAFPGAEVVLKLSEPASIVRLDGVPYPIKAKPVEDARSSIPRRPATVLLPPTWPRASVGADPIEAARAGHRLAGVVVCHPGAIIPRAAMPRGLIPNHANSRKASP